MKNVLILSFLLLIGCKENAKGFITQGENKQIILHEKSITNDFSGKWIFTKTDGNSEVPTLQFTLDILQEGENIKAQYCAVAKRGGKIDCEPTKEFNVNGKIIDKKIKGNFYSFFGSSQDIGEFEISFVDKNTITWKVIRAPKKEFYAPDFCTLIREEKKVSNYVIKDIFPITNNTTDRLKWEESSEFSNYNAVSELPKYKDLFVFLAKNDLGDDEFYTLFTKSLEDKTIDSLKVNYVEYGYPENNKRIITEFTINPDYQINLKKFERKEFNNIFINSCNYAISRDGKFVKITNYKIENK